MRRIPGSAFFLAAMLLAVGVAVAGHGPGPLPPADCPDHDGDGICNGQDPDYVPGEDCPNAECPNPDCPDADGDGICNGQDADYTPPGTGPKRMGQGLEALARGMIQFIGLGFPAP